MHNLHDAVVPKLCIVVQDLSPLDGGGVDHDFTFVGLLLRPERLQ